MSACKQSVALLKQFRAALERLDPQRKELDSVVWSQQNDGDGSFNEASWVAARDAVRTISALQNTIDAAIEACGEVTVVGRRRKR